MPQLLLTILLIALGWALVIRPQQAELRAQRQRRQEHDQMLAGLEAGARSITDPPAPVDEPGVAKHMGRYRYAMDRLWEGLILPDDDRWAKGSAGFDDGQILYTLGMGMRF